MIGEIAGVINKVLGFFSVKERKRRLKGKLRGLKKKRNKTWKAIKKKHAEDKEFLLVDNLNRRISDLEDKLWDYD